MARNYEDLLREPSLAAKFMRAFLGERLFAVQTKCRPHHDAVQQCLESKKGDILSCEEQAASAEHCILHEAFPTEFESFMQCTSTHGDADAAKECGPAYEKMNEDMMKLVKEAQGHPNPLSKAEEEKLKSCVGSDDDKFFNCGVAALPAQKKALDECLSKNSENVRACMPQAEDLLASVANYFKRAGVGAM